VALCLALRGHQFDSNPLLSSLSAFCFPRHHFPIFFNNDLIGLCTINLFIYLFLLFDNKFRRVRACVFVNGVGKDMAVELMLGYGGNSALAAGKIEEDALAVKEAASAGIQSVEKLMRLMSQEQYQEAVADSATDKASTEVSAVADVAVDKFKKVISLLDRRRTGHARFRRAPVAPAPSQPPKTEPVSAFKVYCPNPTPIVRISPLPNNLSHVHRSGLHPQPLPVMGTKNGPGERMDAAAAAASINFSPSPPISAANSFVSTLTGETESFQPSLSSGFQITHMSQVSSAGKPPLSLKRRCNSMDDTAVLKCASSSGRCHCSKKRLVHRCKIFASFYSLIRGGLIFETDSILILFVWAGNPKWRESPESLQLARRWQIFHPMSIPGESTARNLSKDPRIQGVFYVCHSSNLFPLFPVFEKNNFFSNSQK
jgi:hypothetical protein